MATYVKAVSVRKIPEVHGISRDESATVSCNGGRVWSFCLLKVRDLHITAINPALRSLLYLHQGTVHVQGTRWSSWFRHCATSRKVAGSIPDCVTVIFH